MTRTINLRRWISMDRLTRFGWPFPAIAIALWFMPSLAILFLYPLAFFVPFVAAVFVHEGAHAFAARLNGFQVTIFDAFPISARKADDGWQIRRATAFGPSGLVGVAPTDMPTAEFARRFRRMVLAGPLASLVLSPFALVAFWWGISSLFSLVDTPDASPGHGELLPLTFGAALFVGMIAGLVTFIPAQAGGMASDGATIRLLSDPENAAAIQRMLQTTALAFGTRRPRGWSSSEIAKLQRITLTLGRTPLQRQHQLSGALLLTCAYIDHQRFEDAIRVAAFSVGQESGQQADGETQQQALLAFYAYLSAIDMSNGLAAQAALARISEGSPVRRTGVFKSAEALVLAGRGEREAALQAVRIAKVFAARGAMLSKTALVEVDMAAAALIAIDSFDSFGTVSPSSAAHMIGKAA